MNDFDPKSIPNKPGIYAMYYSEKGVAYVGQGVNLQKRIKQHLIKRESSVVVVSAPTMLNPDKVRHVCYWWNHESFSDEKKRKAAECIAVCVLKPSLRSRQAVEKSVKKIIKDQRFCDDMDRFFRGDPDGVYRPHTFDNLVDVVCKLRKDVSELQEQLKEMSKWK